MTEGTRMRVIQPPSELVQPFTNCRGHRYAEEHRARSQRRNAANHVMV
jgi:hypothetical protein